MDRAQKSEFIDSLGQKLAQARMAVVTDYRGTTVASITEFRKKLKAVSGADFQVVKNTLVRRAVDGTTFDAVKAFLTGTNAILLASGDVVEAAKALTEYARENSKLQLKGGVLSGKPMSVEQVQALATLPPKPVLQAQLLGLLNAPAQNLVSVLANANRQVLNVLVAYRDKLEKDAS